MSYLVLARKYRPSTFSEVVGQEHVTRTLGNAFATGRVHHAFLFCGPRGCGKTTLARIVGKVLNCVAGGAAANAAEPCGTCTACASIGNGSAVDYQEMDGASNRGIDAIRELTEAVRYQPAVLRKKVYVIDEVHMLTTEAFNALLKTLEEPPPHVTFVLATTEPHKLPNTILSRCQRYDFKLVPASRLAQHLTSIFAREQLAIEPGAVSLLVRESGGSVRDALSLCDQLISYVGDATITERNVAEVLGVADRSLTRTLVRALAGGEVGAALAAVESAIERGVDEVQLARAIVRYLRDLSVLQVAPGRPELVDASDEERAELVGEARALERSRVSQMFDRMLRCCDELGKTLQPRLVLDCALIDVATIEPLIPLGDLIDRLGELEARLLGKSAPARVTGSGGGGKTAARTASGTPPIAEPPSRPPPARERGRELRGAENPAAAARALAPDPAPAPVSESMLRSAAGPAPAPAIASAPGPAPAPAIASAPGSRSEPPRRPPSPTRQGAAGMPTVADDGIPHAADAAGEQVSMPPPMPPLGDDGIPHAADMRSGPVSMQPSGPVPKPTTVASGSGPSPGAPESAVQAGAPAPEPPAAGRTARPAGATLPGAPAESSRAAAPAESSRAAAPAESSRAAAPAEPSRAAPPAEPAAAAAAAGTVPGRPALAVPVTPADALRAWSEVLAELEARKKLSLSGPFQHARVMRWTADELELGFPSDVHAIGELAAERAVIDELRAVIRELGPELRAIRVSVRMLDAAESDHSAARSVLETSRERSSAERSRREREAREHPITKHVLQTFGAQIKEIKTDV